MFPRDFRTIQTPIMTFFSIEQLRMLIKKHVDLTLGLYDGRAQKLIPYGRQAIDQSDISTVIEIMRSPFLTQGPTVDLFEKAICNKVHAKYSVAVNSATSALHLACLALGLSEGDWLWTSPITFVASANCARYCRAKVDFVDINDETVLIDITVLSSKLEQAEKEGCLPKVVVPVHLAEVVVIWHQFTN